MPYITIPEAMKALAVSDKTIRRHIKAGKIASKRVHGRLLVQVDVLAAPPNLEERVAQLEAKVAALEDALVTLRRQPRPMRKWAGNEPR